MNMINRCLAFLCTLLVVPLFLHADEPPKGRGDTFTGVIATVDAKLGTLSLRIGNDNPAMKDFSFLRETKVLIDGKPAKIEDLKEGMRIQVTCMPGLTDVLSVSVEGKIQKGRLIAVDAAAGTMKVGQEAQEDVVKLAKDCRVLLDGRETKLGDLPARGVVLLKYSTAGDQVVSVEVRRGDGDGEPRPPLPGGRRVNTRGVIKTLNPSTGELVLTIQGEGRKFERDFTIGKDVLIYHFKTPLKLADVKVGKEITIAYMQESKVVVRINLLEFDGVKEPAPREGDKRDGEKKGGDRKEGDRKEGGR